MKTSLTACFLSLLLIFSLQAQIPIGSIDTSFNTSVSPIVLRLQNDGKILAGGTSLLVRLNSNGSIDTNFSCNVSGEVWCIDVQGDGKIVVGGRFTSLNGKARSNFGRLNSDGSTDTNFVTAAIGTTSDFVFSTIVQPNGAVLIAGGFPTIGGVTRNGIARLNSDGSLDTLFSGSGIDGAGICCEARALALQTDGKIIIGGSFSSINGITRNHIARLNADGILDNTFAPQPGPDGYVSSVALQSDGKLIIGGGFTMVDNVTNVGIARLNSNGLVDTNFNAGSGALVTYGGVGVYSVACRQNGDVFVAGGFSSMSGSPRLGLAKLHANGTLDTDFVPNLPPQSRGSCVVVQPDGYILFSAWMGGGPVYRLVNFPPSTGPSTVAVATYAGLTIQGTIGGRYTVKYADDLNSTNWQVLTNLILPSSPYLFFDVNSGGLPRRFYLTVPSP